MLLLGICWSVLLELLFHVSQGVYDERCVMIVGRPRRSMKRLYEESDSQQQQQSETSSQARARLESQEDAELMVQPFGSRTQSDQPATGRDQICQAVLSCTQDVLSHCNHWHTWQ